MCKTCVFAVAASTASPKMRGKVTRKTLTTFILTKQGKLLDFLTVALVVIITNKKCHACNHINKSTFQQINV